MRGHNSLNNSLIMLNIFKLLGNIGLVLLNEKVRTKIAQMDSDKLNHACHIKVLISPPKKFAH